MNRSKWHTTAVSIKILILLTLFLTSMFVNIFCYFVILVNIGDQEDSWALAFFLPYIIFILYMLLTTITPSSMLLTPPVTLSLNFSSVISTIFICLQFVSYSLYTGRVVVVLIAVLSLAICSFCRAEILRICSLYNECSILPDLGFFKLVISGSICT